MNGRREPGSADGTGTLLADLPLAELAARLRGSQAAVECYLGELENRFAEREPRIESFLPEPGRFPRLRREAAELATRYPAADQRPALFAVPIGIKDIFHVDGFPTGGGSRLPPTALAGPQSAVVTALRRAGALVAGKAVSTEFAYFAPGPTRNPRDPARTPGGSSSGSAAAVAAGLCPIALGTQTIGSIGRPASYCGVVGYKPTRGAVSTEGVIPLSPSLDHVGWFARSVVDAALVLTVLRPRAGSGHQPVRPVLGIPEGPYLDNAEPATRDWFETACAALRSAGYRVVGAGVMPDFEAIAGRHRRIVAIEAAAVHAEWFERHAELYHAKTRDLIDEGRRLGDDGLARDLAGRDRLRDELGRAMDDHGIDLWLSPAAPGTAPAGLDSTGNPILNLPWTHAGVPTLTVPAGRGDDGMPLGLQLAARWGADESLLGWAADLERALGGERRQP